SGNRSVRPQQFAENAPELLRSRSLPGLGPGRVVRRMRFTESVLEEAALEWLGNLGYSILHGPEIAPGELAAERTNYSEVVLGKRLDSALHKLNPTVAADVLEEALRQITLASLPSLIGNNHAFHRLLVNG